MGKDISTSETPEVSVNIQCLQLEELRPLLTVMTFARGDWFLRSHALVLINAGHMPKADTSSIC